MSLEVHTSAVRILTPCSLVYRYGLFTRLYFTGKCSGDGRNATKTSATGWTTNYGRTIGYTLAQLQEINPTTALVFRLSQILPIKRQTS